MNPLARTPSTDRRPRAGFTLVELLLVVAIIAVLAAFTSGGRMRNARGTADRARVSRVKSDMRSMATALDSYVLHHGALPPTITSPSTGTEAAGAHGAVGGVGGLPPALTTPVAYLVSLFPDALSPVKGESLRYYARGDEFLLFSAGPDRKYDIRNPESALERETEGEPGGPAGPDSELRRSREFDATRVRLIPFTYDPTNGATSAGDVWRHGVAAPPPAQPAQPEQPALEGPMGSPEAAAPAVVTPDLADPTLADPALGDPALAAPALPASGAPAP